MRDESVVKNVSGIDWWKLSYYGVFLGGLGLVGFYMYYAFITFGLSDFMALLFFGSAGAFWVITLTTTFLHSRPLRLLFTILSGATAGAHYLLSTLMFGPSGTLFYIILGLGVIMSGSTFAWLRDNFRS